MPAFNLDFEVYCATCGAGLCNDSEVCKTYDRNQQSVRVNACSNCVRVAQDAGYKSGDQDGHDNRQEEVEDLEERLREAQEELARFQQAVG